MLNEICLVFVQANVGQFSLVTGVELEFLLFKPSNINKITHFIWYPLNFEGICSKEDSIQVRTLLNCLCFGTGLYSSQDSIQVRLLLATLRYIYSIYKKYVDSRRVWKCLSYFWKISRKAAISTFRW